MYLSPAFRRNALQALLAAVLLPGAFAQSSPAATTVAPTPSQDDSLELSPFTVTADSDVGYLATSSLAGSRINTPLKNIASQIDVMTPEFLEDIGAVNLSDAVEYSSNTGGANQQNVGPNSSTDDVRNEGRARGFDAVTLSSDFFATNLPSDFYAIERLTIANGPQSILFGLGNAGGVLDVTTKKAFFRDAGYVEFRTDAEGSLRSVLDVNKQLLEKRLAIRIVGLHGADNQFIDGGFSDSNRVFGTATLRLFKNTNIRVSAEKLWLKLSNATNYVSQDFLSPWVAAGRPLFDNDRGNAAVNNATSPTFSRNATVPRVVSYGADGAIGVRTWNGSAVTKGPHQVPGAVDTRDRSLLDGSIFPVDADPRVAARLNDIDGYFVRAVIEQKLGDDLFLELGANYEKRHEFAGGIFNPGESINIFADPNRYLPGGTAASPQTALNPNAGQLYIEALPNGTERVDITEEARLSLSYEFDFAKKLDGRWSWLGRHRLIGLLSQRQDESLSQANRAMVVGNASFTTGDKLNNSRNVRMRYYLNPATGNLGAGALQNTVTGPWTFQDSVSGQSFEARLFGNPDGSSGVTNGNQADVFTQMVAFQSDFLKERVNLFFGYREDALKLYDVSAASNLRQDYLVANDRLGLYRNLSGADYDSSALVDDTGRSKSYGAVVHPLTWFSLFYSQSENYALPPGYRGPDDQPLPGTFSDGRDYGVRTDFWSGRFSARLNFYEETQNANLSGTIQGLRDYAAVVEERLRGANAPVGIGPVPVDGFDPVTRGTDAYRASEYKDSKGIDLTLVARPVSNWDIRLSGGRQLTKVSGKAEDFATWIEGRLPVWTSAGGLGWQNVTVTPTDSRTIQQYYNEVIAREIDSNRARNQLLRYRQREWRSALFTNYRFETGFLKGFSVGGGTRWLSKALVGFQQTTLANGNREDDVTKPIYNDPLFFLDFVVAYKRPITLAGKRLGLRVQVNVRNVLDDDDLETIRAAWDGGPLDVARTVGRQIVVTTRFSF